MPKHNQNSKISLIRQNVGQSQMWNRRIALGSIFTSLLGILVGIGLLIQTYITHTPALKVLVVSYTFKPGFELLGYSASVLLIVGCLTQIIALNISQLLIRQRKQMSYIWAFIGAVLVFFSFGLWLISLKPGLTCWSYFQHGVAGTGFTTLIFSRLVGTERKQLRFILEFITFVLMLMPLVRSFLK